MTKGRIWINIPDHFDIGIIISGLESNGFGYKRGLVNADDEENTIRMSEGCVGVISRLEPWNRRTLSAVGGHVKIIVRYGSGYNNIDIVAAQENGIAVFNTAGRNAPAVAELALLHMLNAGRLFCPGIEIAKRGGAPFKEEQCTELDGKTVGLYGAGAIATHLARMLSGFRVSIKVFDIKENDAIKKYGAEFVKSPEELFESCDIVSLHIPLLPETEGLVNRALLARMRPGAILINTSRGGVINEEDLLEALKTGRIRATGLDVLREEPVRSNNPLVLQGNSYVTPHIAATSFESKLRVERCLYETIAGFFNGDFDTVFPINYLNPHAKVV